MPEVARLSVVVTADTRDLERDLDRAEKGVQGFATASKKHAGVAATAFGGVLGTLSTLGTAALGGGVIGAGLSALSDVFTSPITAASDLAESLNKTNVVFGAMADGVHDFALTAAQDLGLSRQQAEEAAGTFGNLFTSMGLGQGEAAGLSTKILTLGADLASFNNIRPEDALEKLRSGLVGEAEPLRALGINLNEAAVKARAMQLGLVDASGQVTEAGKVQARYSLILEQTKNAQGDFARTSDGMANAIRIIQASFKDIQAVIGDEILPVLAPLVSAFAKALPDALAAARPYIYAVGEALAVVGRAIGALVAGFQTGGLVGAIDAWLGVARGFGRDLGAQVQAWAKTLVDWIAPLVAPVLRALGDLLVRVGSWIVDEAAPALARQLGAWAKAFADWIGPAADAFLRAWPANLTRFLDWIEDTAAPAIGRTLKSWVAAFVDWVTGAGGAEAGLFAVVGKIAEVLLRFVAETAAVLGPRLLVWSAKFLGWVVTDVLPFLAVELGKILVAIGNWLAHDAVPWALGAMKDLGVAIVQGIVAGILSVPGAIADAIKSLVPPTITLGQPSTPARAAAPSYATVPPQWQPAPGTAGGISLVPLRDRGGWGAAGQSYLIGTGAQPELFTPRAAGAFTPVGGYGGGDVTVPVYVGGELLTTVVARANQRRADRGGYLPRAAIPGPGL